MENNKKIYRPEHLKCPVCGAINANKSKKLYCYRCDSRIYKNIDYGTSKAWAFLITALILYVPANIYPILLNQKFYEHGANTIVGGVLLLWEEGSYPIAIIIFIASIMVPILKFIALIYLLISAKMKNHDYSKINRHGLHYMTEIIGPWSMVDVFVVSLLTGLVHLHNIEVIAGPGATAFVLMVVFTMFSALSIDPRLFDKKENNV